MVTLILRVRTETGEDGTRNIVVELEDRDTSETFGFRGALEYTGRAFEVFGYKIENFGFSAKWNGSLIWDITPANSGLSDYKNLPRAFRFLYGRATIPGITYNPETTYRGGRTIDETRNIFRKAVANYIRRETKGDIRLIED